MYNNSPIASWRNQASVYLLQGVQCLTCSALFYPRKYICTCGSTSFADYKFSGKATLVSFTQVTLACAEFSPYTPYCIGIVELEEGLRVLMQLADVDLEELKIGMRMVAVFRRYFAAGDAGMIFYGLKFIPEKYA